MPAWLDDFIKQYGSNTLIAGVILFLLGLFLRDLAPWFLRQLQKLFSALVAQLGGNSADYKFERAYVQWLILQSAGLGLLPSNVAVSARQQEAELEKVFVDLVLTTTGEAAQPAARGERDLFDPQLYRSQTRGVWRFLPQRFQPRPARAQSELGRALEQFPRLVIRGDPGSGKTTLLKYLTVTCARSLRNKPKLGDAPDLVKQRLGWNTRPFPIYVSLGRQTNVAGWGEERSLLNAFQDEYARELEKGPPDFFKQRLERGNCLVMLDAFDEIGSREGRAAMAKYITQLVNTYGERHNYFIVTTRQVGYEGYEQQFSRAQFGVQTVVKLNAAQINQLVTLRYQAIALREAANQTPDLAHATHTKYKRQAEQLRAALARNARVRELADTPLLLSLIVLVHSARPVLPEARHLLYKNCVEILAQEWRQYRREELEVTAPRADLNLDEKILLLQLIALRIQQQRADKTEGQVSLKRRDAEALIAEQLPQFIPDQLPAEPNARRKVCFEKAAEWIEGTKLESGILVEIGLDDAGEPLVRFSHLTFQEYLAARALAETFGEPTLLLQNLFQPAWEEVALLYMAMPARLAPNAHAYAHAELLATRLLNAPAPNETRGVLIATRALYDQVTLPDATRTAITTRLQTLTRGRDETERARAAELMNDLALPQFIPTLLQMVEHDPEWNVRLLAAQALAKVGDPRAFDEMIDLPADEFLYGDEKRVEKIQQPYRIAKYLVTNAQYKKFADATGRNAEPFPPAKANHPVVEVSWHDAVAYCEWLSQTTKRKFRLPTEQEWERAARGTDGREYPWGNEFDKYKVNSEELGLGGTSPVGIFLQGASPCGALDMAGNVWEWTASEYDKSSRVLRGGSFIDDSRIVRCAYRNPYFPAVRFNDYGFRVAESFP